METIEALLAGYTTRPHPTAFAFPASQAAFGSASSSQRGDFEAGGPFDMGFMSALAPSAAGARAGRGGAVVFLQKIGLWVGS